MACPITTPSDLFALIPHLAGHDIDDAYAVVGLYPGPMVHVIWFVEDTTLPALAKLREAFREVTLDAVVIVGYAPIDTSTAALDILAQVAVAAGVTDVTRLVNHGGRYWDLSDPDCPAIGRPIETSPELAAHLATGPAPAASEEAVAEALAPVTGDARAAMAEAAAQVAAELADDPRLLEYPDLSTILSGGDLNSYGTARLVAALAHSDTVTVAAMITTTIAPVNSLRLWIHLVRHAEPDLRGKPALLTAYAAQLNAKGMLAHHAITIAEDLIPEHPFTRPLAAAIRSGCLPTDLLDALDPRNLR